MDNKLLTEFCENIKRCNCDKIHMVPPAFMHAAIGISDETGEIMEILKRALYYGDKIDNSHLMEEYGDIMFYIMLDCMRIGQEGKVSVDMVFDRIFRGNINKLRVRYPSGFSEAKATKSGRDREAERDAMNKPELEKLQSKPGIDHIGKRGTEGSRHG